MEPTLADAQFSCLSYKAARLTRNVGQNNMNTVHQQFIEELSNTEPDVTALNELVDKYDNTVEFEPLFDPILKFMEMHHSADLGSPGPLVHFIEKGYPKYIDSLRNSINRKPTLRTVWMLNRILNASLEDELRVELLRLMTAVTEHPQADEVTKNQANEFLIHQKDN